MEHCFIRKQKDQSWVRGSIQHCCLLTPRALAYWYMDDGALKWRGKSNAVRLCTDSFIDDINLKKKVLETKFSLKVSLQKRIYPKIMHFRRILLELKDLIVPYLIPACIISFLME
jgi:hypothetical protein